MDGNEERTSNEKQSERRSEGARFTIGRVVITQHALGVLKPCEIATALSRHRAGDWGECCEHDRKENERSLKRGSRLFSVYRSAEVGRFWVITEADRSSTCVLMPEDY